MAAAAAGAGAGASADAKSSSQHSGPDVVAAVDAQTGYMIHVRINEAKNVLAKDSNGKSDPYVSIAVGGDHLTKPKVKPLHKEKTAVIKETLCPVWNQDFSFSLDRLDGNMRLKVWDYDLGRKNDFLGQVYVRLNALKRTGVLTGWHPLLDKKNQLSQGALYFSVIVDTVDRAKAWKNHKKPNADELKALTELRNGLFGALEVAERTTKAHLPALAATPSNPLSIFTATWNVGNASPADDLRAWLHPKPDTFHDLYVIAVQECTYKPRKKDVTRSHDDWDGVLAQQFAQLSDAWATHVRGGAPKPNDSKVASGEHKDEYVLVRSCSLLEMRLSLYARRHLGPRISLVETHTEATGLAHVVGNKGGAVINCQVDDLRLCFVGSHLAAHQGKCERRNADFAEIVSGVRLGQHAVDMLHQFHHVFWLGDLNYRLDYGGGAQGADHKPSPQLFGEMVAKINDKKYGELFATDQLTRERKAERAFVGFHEGAYDFAPTFKVIKGKPNEYNPERSPAWCDRILWRSFPGHTVTQTSFGSAPALITSDHKPVYGTFTVHSFVLPNGRDSTRGALSFTVTNLKARGLPVADVKTKSADPYVVFAAPFFDKPYATATVRKTLNPDWKDAEVPVLVSTLNSAARLRQSFLCVVVKDKDTVSQDDPMADSVLFLADVIAAAEQGKGPQPFKLVVSRGGLPTGTLEGCIEAKWAPLPATPDAAVVPVAALAKYGFDAATLAKYKLK